MKSKNNTKRKSVARSGIKIEYNGKQYISLKELCMDLNLSYSSLSHKYYKTQNIEEAVRWATKVKTESENYVVWGKKYDSVSEIAKQFGLNVSSLYKRIKEGISIEDTVTTMLQKETISFEGRDYTGVTELSVAYGHDSRIVFERIYNGMSLERAIYQKIRDIDRPEFEVECEGIMYKSKRQLSRELGIGGICIKEVMENNDVDYETAVYILKETKKRAGIPREQMISRIPAFIIHGKVYNTLKEFAHFYAISPGVISTYKCRHECEGILETVCKMQDEMKLNYVLNGKCMSEKELCKMGYSRNQIRELPRKDVPRYPQLIEKDFVTNCVDVLKIYQEVKQEVLCSEQTMEMSM